MAHDVFISHSSKDKPLADAICAKLEEDNIRCWIAPRDVGPGQDWPTAIVEAIKSSKIMVLVFSKYSNKSKQVKKELSVAVNSESIIIPFKIDKTPLEGPMELFLTDTHWLDAMNPPTERDIENLVDSVRKFVPTNRQFDAKKELGKPLFDKEEQRNNLVGKKGEGQKQTSSGEGKNLKGTLVWAGPGLVVATGIILLLLGLGGSGPLSFLEREPVPSATQTPTETAPLTETQAPTETSTPTIAPTATLDVGSTQTSSVDGMVQFYIPAGTFLMGSTDEKPVHEVYMDAFWMDQHEVTNAQYAAFLNEVGNQEEGGVTWLDAGYGGVLIGKSDGEWVPNTGHEDHPVKKVSWYGARAYCEWAGRRLPTEAEWEKGARGGLTGMKYPWGDESPVFTLGAANGARFNMFGGITLPVKSYAPNGYGLYDMAGNVLEWAADWYDYEYYSSSPYENPQGPSDGEYRVLRGGSWRSGFYSLHVAYRDGYFPVIKTVLIGFRCAASPE